MNQRIDVDDDHELHVWARTFGISQDDLKRLVDAWGPSPAEIRNALKREELAHSNGRNRDGRSK